MKSNATTFGSSLRNFRKERKLTQLELSERLGYSQSTISSLEAGLREPTVKQAQEICDFFNLKLSDFIDDKLQLTKDELDQVNRNKEILIKYSDNQEFIRLKDMDFINKYMSLTDDQKSVVATLVDGLLK